MSVTLIHQPDEISHAFNPQYFIISATSYSASTFRYTANFAYGSVLGSENSLDRYTFPPRLDGTAIIDLHSVLKYTTQSVCNHSISAVTPSREGYQRVFVAFGEQLSGVTTFDLGSITRYRIIDAIKQYDEVNDLVNYDVGSVSSAKFLTDWNYTKTKRIRANEYETLSVFGTGSTNQFKINTYTSAGGLITTYTLTAGFETGFSAALCYDLPVGTRNLTFSGNVGYYEVWVALSGTVKTVVQKYIIDTTPLRYDSQRLCWKNRKGKFDYFTFDVADRQSIEMNKVLWEKKLDWDYSIGDRGINTLANITTNKMVINTNWIYQYESDFLYNSLFTSGEVYLIKGNGNRIPVTIIDKGFDKKTISQDGLISYPITLQLPNIITQGT